MDAVREVPLRLGRYEIVERLAAGGMGEVFVARSFGAGGFIKPVALKRIHPHLAENEAFIHMLHDEANVASAIRHPNIVATIDVGCEGDNHFVVLDYVSGDPLNRTLRELRKRKLKMPAWVAVWVGAQIASALQGAHEAKSLQGERLDIVHRDVSLANIMLSDAGHPMLFDFGVAKAAQRIHQTMSGELKGKLCYMAPETFHGVPVDRTIDIFSLGVVLYELLTGKSPFQRDSDLETIAAVQRAQVPPPSHLRPEIDPALDAIVLRAMARERAERYATAIALEHDLRAWARAAGVPHDAGEVATWLLDNFPERLLARRALLARVADPGEVTIVEGLQLGAIEGGGTPVSGPISGPLVGGLARAGATPHSNRISMGLPAAGGTPVSAAGGTQIMAAGVGTTTLPPSATDSGIARPTSAAGTTSPSQVIPLELRPRRGRTTLLGGLIGAAVGIGGVILLMRGASPPPADAHAEAAAAGPVVTAAPASPGPPATAAPTVSPDDAATAASSAASADPGSPPRPGEASPKRQPAQAAVRKPAEQKTPKGKGPLQRNYEP